MVTLGSQKIHFKLKWNKKNQRKFFGSFTHPKKHLRLTTLEVPRKTSDLINIDIDQSLHSSFSSITTSIPGSPVRSIEITPSPVTPPKNILPSNTYVKRFPVKILYIIIIIYIFRLSPNLSPIKITTPSSATEIISGSPDVPKR